MRLKTLTLLLVLAVAASLAVAAHPRLAQSEPLVYGDVDCSSYVDSIDALLILQTVAFQTWYFPCPKNTDLDNNGAVTASDALFVLQFHARLLQRLGPSDATIPAVALALGDKHSCALTAQGGLKCWGDNSSGQLGDGTTSSRRIPVDAVAPSQNFVAITAGREHTCALTDIGGVRCWGRNSLGQLGNGMSSGPQLCFDPGGLGEDYACSRTAVDVTGLASGVRSISAGADHTCAVLADDGVKCWGLAMNRAVSELCTRFEYPCSTVPLNVGTFSEGVAKIEVGFSHTCILTTPGAVKCWGANSDGQLGDGTTTDIDTPVEVNGLTDRVTALALGETHTCVLTVGGAVECWGGNAAGQVGTPLTECAPLPACRIMAPVVVTGLSSGVLAITADVRHNCVLTENGGAKCWGESGFGVLGAGGQEQCYGGPCSSTPLDVTGLSSDAVQLAAGRLHNCVIVDEGSAQCWGFNFYEQLGVKTPNEETQCFCSQAPVSVFGFGRTKP